MAVDKPESQDATEHEEGPRSERAEADAEIPSSEAVGDPSDSTAARVEPSSPSDEPGAKRPRRATARFVGGSPPWVVPLYVIGLILVYAGERALSAVESLTWVLDGLGVAFMLLATGVRFSPAFAAKGERATIERLMKGLSVIGLLAVALYFCTTDAGQERIGLAQAAFETRERVLGVLTVVWIALVLISVLPMVFAEASLAPMRRSTRPESLRVRLAASAGLALALAAVYGSLFVFAAWGADIKVDYSYFKTSGPSESTKKIARDLEDRIFVTAFFPDVNEVKGEVEGYLSELAKAAPKLKIEFVDRLMEPKKAQELKATEDGMLFLSQGETRRSLNLGTDIQKARDKLKTLDKDFQEQLVKLARSRRTVYLTVGHGELNDGRGGKQSSGRSAQIAKKLLEKQNYTVKDLGAAQGLANAVPEDADIVMILGPTEPFLKEEIATLKRFAEDGGKLFIAVDPDALSTSEAVTADAELAAPEAAAPEAEGDEVPAVASAEPAAAARPSSDGLQANLQQLVEVVGVRYMPTVLVNEQRHIRRRFNDSDRAILITSSFSSHASVSTLSRNAPRAAVVVSGAGSLESATPGQNPPLNYTVRAAAGTFADLNRDFRQDPSTEPTNATFNIAAAVEKATEGKNKPDDAKKNDKKKDDKAKEVALPEGLRAFVVADSDALSDLLMSNVPANQVLFFDAVRWLGGEESWAGEQSSEEDVAIEHTKKEDQIWFYSTIFGVPALVLGAGVWTSRRARRRGTRGRR